MYDKAKIQLNSKFDNNIIKSSSTPVPVKKNTHKRIHVIIYNTNTERALHCNIVR